MKQKKMIAWRDRLMPTTSAHQARFQLFQPTFSPRPDERKIETPYMHGGSVTVRGRLGQSHALFIEAVCWNAMMKKTLENGVTALLADPQDIRKTMSGKAGQRYSWTHIVRLARELKEASILIDLDGWPAVDGLLDRFYPHFTAVRKNPIPGRRERKMYVAEISPTFSAWLNHDPLPLHYDPTPLAHLRHAVSAAVARWVLGQRDEPTGGWMVDTVLRAVGAGGRKKRWELRQDATALAMAGVEVGGDRVRLPGRSVHARLRSVHARGVPSTPASVPPTPASAGSIQESPTGDFQERRRWRVGLRPPAPAAPE